MNERERAAVEEIATALARLMGATAADPGLTRILRVGCRDSDLVYWVARGRVPHTCVLSHN